MDNRLLSSQATKLAVWIMENGYTDLIEWGLDSDLTCVGGVWFNEHGDEVDLFSVAWYAMEASNEGL